MKRAFLSIALALGLVAAPAFAQGDRVFVSPARDLVTVQLEPMNAAADSGWIDLSDYAVTRHTLTFTYTTQPGAVTVTFYCSNDNGVSATSTLGTSTSTTGDTIQADAFCNAIKVTTTGLTGSIRIKPVYRGSNPASGSINAAVTIADGALATLGGKTDDKSTATDTTSVSLMSVIKQLSASVQAMKTAIDTLAGTVSASAGRVRYTDGTDMLPSNVAPVSFTVRNLAVPLTALTFTETGGTAVFTPKNVATGAGRVSDRTDRGTGALATLFKWEATFKAQASVTIGLPVRVYAYCHENANTTADYVADAAVTAETQFSNFKLIGTIYASANSVGPFYNSGDVFLTGRYCEVGMWNASGQTLTNVNGDNKVTLTPYPGQPVTQ
jgi:hypothetical protein